MSPPAPPPETKQTPPPHPGPLRQPIGVPQSPGARSARLARGRRGRTGGATCVPPPPFGGDRGMWAGLAANLYLDRTTPQGRTWLPETRLAPRMRDGLSRCVGSSSLGSKPTVPSPQIGLRDLGLSRQLHDLTLHRVRAIGLRQRLHEKAGEGLERLELPACGPHVDGNHAPAKALGEAPDPVRIHVKLHGGQLHAEAPKLARASAHLVGAGEGMRPVSAGLAAVAHLGDDGAVVVGPRRHRALEVHDGDLHDVGGKLQRRRDAGAPLPPRRPRRRC